MRIGLMTLGFALLAATLAQADEVPATLTAAKREVMFHVDVAGAFDAKEALEVAYRPQVWGDELEVEESRAPGPVEAGGLLVRFKSEKLDDAVRAAERDLAVARAALAVQAEESRGQELATATALALAEKAARDAREALDTFLKIDRALRLEEADHGIQGSRNWITDQTEELAQLEKMYKADDLTEETEDIVLKRTRRDLERNQKGVDFRLRRDKLMREIELPRELEGLELSARKSGEERDHAVSVTKLQRAQASLELDRVKANLEKQARDVARLVADRELLLVKAPEAGFAVPGMLVRGKWQNADDVRRALRKGGRARPNDVLFTLLRSEEVRIVASLPEAALGWVRTGQDAKVVATQPGVAPSTAKVGAVTPFSSSGEYAVDLDLVDRASGLVGMTCRVRIETGKRAAILVPAAAVEDGGFDKWVHVVGTDGKAARRAVVLGQPHVDEVEVVTGLAEGDKFLAAAPKK